MSYRHIESFTFTKDAYLAKVPDPFLVEGLIHRSMTLIHGQTTSGKSMLAMSLAIAVASGSSNWNGQTLSGCGPVTWVGGDPGVKWEAYERLDRVRDTLEGGQIHIVAPERPTRHEAWEEIAAASEGSKMLVLDNLTQFVAGSLNDDSAVRAVMEELTALSRRDIAVVVLAHTSDKRNEQGYSSDKPAGSFSIRSIPRWFIGINRHDGRDIQLKMAGNDDRPWEMYLSEPSDRPEFEVLEVVAAETVAAKKSKRGRDVLDRNAEVYRLLDADMSGKDIAAKLGMHQSQVSRIKNSRPSQGT